MNADPVVLSQGFTNEHAERGSYRNLDRNQCRIDDPPLSGPRTIPDPKSIRSEQEAW